MERFKLLLDYGIEAWPYLVLILVYSVVFFFPHRYRKFVWYLVVCVVIFFGGFKDIMSPDFKRYEIMYTHYETLSFTSIEPLFIFISWFFNLFEANFYFLSFTYFLLTIVFITLAIRNLTTRFEYGFFIYLTIPGFFLNTFVEMRQCLAVSAFFYAVSLFMKGKKKSWIFFLLSALSHYSSVFAIALFFLTQRFLKKQYSLRFYLALLTSALIMGRLFFLFPLFEFLLPLIPQKYRIYLFTIKFEEAELLKTTIYFFFTILTIILFSTLSEERKDRLAIYLNLFVLGSIIILISHNPELTRGAYYFLTFQLPLIPEILYSMGITSRERLLIRYTFTLYFLTQYLYGLFYIPVETGEFVFIPYRNVLLK